MPPPPSPMKITEEQVPAQQSVSPLDLCKSVMSKEVKEKFDKDRDLQAFIEKLLELFTSAQNISIKAPLYMASGYQLGPESQSRTFATITSTFERNPEQLKRNQSRDQGTIFIIFQNSRCQTLGSEKTKNYITEARGNYP